MLRKTITRCLEFGVEEIQTALLEWLKSMDQAFPKEGCSWDHRSDGKIILEWKETTEKAQAIT